MNRLFILVDKIADVLTAGYTVVRVYTDTSESGAFTTLDGTVTLAAATESYSYTDLDGTQATWYKTAYFGSSPGEGDKSEARKADTSAAYATVEELRGQLKKVGQTDDIELALLLDAVTSSVNTILNRPDGLVAEPTASTREYSGQGIAYIYIDDCIGITLVEVKDSPSDTTYTAWTATDWIAARGSVEAPDFNRDPKQLLITLASGDFDVFTNGAYTGLRGFRTRFAYQRALPTVRVTAQWGYAAIVPGVIKEATIAQAARWYARGKSSWSRSTAQPSQGQLRTNTTTRDLLPDEDIRTMILGSRLVQPAIGRRR